MKIKLQTGDFKIEEQDQQLPAEVEKYAGRDNHSIRDFNKTPHGVPSGALQYTVGASYDIRPVNAVDFNAKFITAVPFVLTNQNDVMNFTLSKLESPYPGGGSTEATVPPGNVFIVRSLSAFINATIGTNNKIGYYAGLRANVTVYLNDQPVPAASNISVDWDSADIPLYFIIDENTRITVKYNCFSFATLSMDFLLLWPSVTLYGNLLVKSGIPKQFEGANVNIVK